MRDTEFFEKALGLEAPWRVKAVSMDVAKRRVEVEVECEAGTAWGCEEGRLHIQGYEERQWRHLDTMQFETMIKARVPRVKYPDGRTEMVKVPWAGARSRFTLLFECWAIEVLAASRSISEGCDLLGLDWSSGQRIMKQAVARGLERRSLEGIERIGMDEKSFGRGQDYISVMNDLDKGRVLEVTPGRDVQSGCELWRTLPEEQRSQVKAVAIDMSAGFEAAARQEAAQAQIVYDKFHVSKSLNEAVDKVRKEEHRHLSKEGDQRLKGSRQLWLYNPVNLDEERMEGFQKLLAENLKTSRAWIVKENFSGFWDQEGTWQGEQYFRAWYSHAVRTRLAPIKKVAKSLKRHIEGLLNYFTHRISNAMSESLNSRIQSLKANARGFRAFENYRIRILFFLGKLDLKPAL